MPTYSDLKANVTLELGLDDTVGGDEDLLLGRRLNEGVREVLKRTRCFVSVASVDLTADEGDYELPADVLAITDIVNSEDTPLERESVGKILELRRGSNPTGTITYRYALNGANLLMIYPMPNGADTITIYYVPRPTEMSSSAHDPSSVVYGGIPAEYHHLIEYWAMYRLASFDDDASSGMGEAYRQRFEEEVVRARAAMRRRGGRSLGPARVGRRSRVPWNPGQDIWRG